MYLPPRCLKVLVCFLDGKVTVITCSANDKRCCCETVYPGMQKQTQLEMSCKHWNADRCPSMQIIEDEAFCTSTPFSCLTDKKTGMTVAKAPSNGNEFLTSLCFISIYLEDATCRLFI